MPIRAEGATDEDLLEDAKLAIERYLHAGGYRDALVNYSRDDTTPGQLKITFHVMRGRALHRGARPHHGELRRSPVAELEKIVVMAPR